MSLMMRKRIDWGSFEGTIRRCLGDVENVFSLL